MSRTPVWKTIYETLRGDIVGGAFKAGDKLPTEKDYAERFAVNRHTVRRALAELSQAGIIAVRRGSGAYVAEGVIDYKIGKRTRFSQNVADLGRTPNNRLVKAETGAAPDRVAARLGLRVGRDVVMIEMIGEADDTPICVSEQYFPADRFPGFDAAVAETRSVTAAMTRYGVVDYTRAWTRISAIAPSRTIAKKLQQPDNAPVLRAEALNLDMAGQAIEYAITYFAGQRSALMVDNAPNADSSSAVGAPRSGWTAGPGPSSENAPISTPGGVGTPTPAPPAAGAANDL